MENEPLKVFVTNFPKTDGFKEKAGEAILTAIAGGAIAIFTGILLKKMEEAQEAQKELPRKTQ